MEYRLHDSCKGCTAHAKDNVDNHYCRLGTDIHEPATPIDYCFRPENEVQFALLANCSSVDNGNMPNKSIERGYREDLEGMYSPV